MNHADDDGTLPFSVPCSGCLQAIRLFPHLRGNKLQNMAGLLFQGQCGLNACKRRNSPIFVCKCCVQQQNLTVDLQSGHRTKLKGICNRWNDIAKHGTTAFHISHMPRTSDDNLPVCEPTHDTESDFCSDLGIDPSRLECLTSEDFLQQEGGFNKESTSPSYFWFEHKHPGQGIRNLTAKAFNVPLEEVTDAEAHFALLISNLLLQLSESQRRLLAECLLHATNSGSKELSIFKKSRVPTSEEDFQLLYLTGKNAIIPNLPHPVPVSTPDGTHAYATLTDVLANELAKGTEFDKFYFDSNQFIPPPSPGTEIVSISKTKAGHELFWELQQNGMEEDEYVLYLWLREWRDDFDPNNTKASRNQVWINTNTICPPGKEKEGRNSFFMAIGAKGDDHSEVERLLAADLGELSLGKKFYHGGLKRLVNVKIGKINTCVDRPERSSIFHVGDHNGTYSACWGKASSVDGQCNENHLPSCNQCRKQRIERQLGNRSEHAGEDTVCLGGTCSGWDMFKDCFSFPPPKHYPVTCDIRQEAPKPPPGRSVLCSPAASNTDRTSLFEFDHPPESPEQNNNSSTQSSKRARLGVSKLRSVELSTQWLKQAATFAHHNMKTCPPGARANKRYWTKQNLSAYLRSCGATARLINEIYRSARENESEPTFPPSWEHPKAISRCHYAPMHMLFLGHIKSNFEMVSKWLGSYEINATFGKQVNTILTAVQRLRCTKWFGAYPLSTSKWGTGGWVSENYMFWGRTLKYFHVLPSIQASRQMIRSETFPKEARMIMRFASSAQAAVSRIMSMDSEVGDMERMIKIYMDSMMEVDMWLINGSNIEEDNEVGLESTTATGQNSGRKKQPNFTKANSLGILQAHGSHDFSGPATLYWEGGYAGERKIQGVKPLLGIKRGTADWQTITLRKLYQQDTKSWMLQTIAEKKGTRTTSRDMEGVLRIFRNLPDAEDAIARGHPFTGVKDGANKLWIPHREAQTGLSRSSLVLSLLHVKDSEGENYCDMCWFAPVSVLDERKSFSCMADLKGFASEYTLFLPKFLNNGSWTDSSSYYCIGHKWTERTRDGVFQRPDLAENVFNDWTLPATNRNNEQVVQDVGGLQVATI